MWTLAVSMDVIFSKEKCFKEVYPVRTEVTFRRPLTLGTQAVLRYTTPRGQNHVCQFQVVGSRDMEKVILEGRIYTGDCDM